jgi:hypothetical protein
MDWHKLQHQLFELDPTDPKEDLKRLQQQASNGREEPMPEHTKNPVTESYNVSEGSMPVDVDSVSDFAALAGISLNEGKHKTGSSAQLKGRDKVSKSKSTAGPEQKNVNKGKLVGDSIDNDKEDRITNLETRLEKLESVILEMAKTKKQQEMPKQRDPSASAMQDIRKSGAAGKHINKKDKSGRKAKHKGKTPELESLKDQLFKALNNTNEDC